MLQESKQMVPDTDRRLKLAVDDLDMLIVSPSSTLFQIQIIK